MADRSELSQEISALLQRLSRRPQSSLHLMWAWFGAGKTHALHYLSHLARTAYDNIEPIYTEFPKSARGFVDLYWQVATTWDLNHFTDAYLEEATRPAGAREEGRQPASESDVWTALKLLAAGTEKEQSIAREWFRGDRLTTAVLKPAGINHAIEAPEDCCRVFNALISLYGQSKELSVSRPGRTIWIIDEFQRITACAPEVRREITTSLHSLLNLCPNHLTIFLSFSGRPEKRLPAWLSPELEDRIGIERVLVLPPLRLDEAKAFVIDLLREYRPKSYRRSPYFPFEEKAVDAVIELIAKKSELKPRSLMQFFGAILEEADVDIEKGIRRTISEDFARSCFVGRSFSAEAEELEEMVSVLQESRTRALNAKEAVQKEIAAHLHGPVQGRLLGLRAKLDELARAESVPADASAGLRTVIQDMDQVIQREIAALSRRLYPAIIRRGLVPSLQSLCDQFESTVNIELTLDQNFAARERGHGGLLDEQTRLAAYRVAEEALNNIVKHSKASHVLVQLELTDDGWVVLTVQDDGAGFDLERRSAGLGLSEMRDYAEAAGGSCNLRSQPGRGTEVVARLPAGKAADVAHDLA